MNSSHSFARGLSPQRFVPQVLLYLALASLILGFVSTACAQQQDKHPAQPAVSPAALKPEGLPIGFEPNLKQADARYRFLAHQNGFAIGFLEHSIELRLATKAGSADVVGISFERSRSIATSAEELLPGRVNYLRGSDPSAFQRNIPTYARVRYTSLYPGTDLVFYGNASRIEHDFVLAPGADPRAIALRFTGMRDLQLTSAGDLRIDTAQASIEFHRPFAYQETSHGKVEVAAAYRLRNHRATFNVGPYDRSLPLIIDPVLDYSTFLADSAINTAFIATDAAGNTYITSLMFDAAYPTTPGSLQPACASCASNKADVVVTKLSADGSGQVYSTFLGGNDLDQPFGIAVDGNGNAIVVGRTQSADFPVKNPASTPTVGFAQFSAFVSSLSADGSALNYSTLLGSGFNVLATAVAVDSTGNAYVTGDTSDATFPVTPGALHAVQNNTTGGGDTLIFLSKFLPTGALSYSALIGDAAPQNGGGGPIGVAAVTVDATGNAYIYGNAGTLWPITQGVFQPTIPGLFPYAAPFVSKVAPDGASFVYSTFVGDGFQSLSIVVDGTGQAILSGFGPNTDYPVTPDARVGTLPQFSNNGWLTKLNASGTALVYSSFLTSGDLSPSQMTVDGTGNIWVVGRTADFQFPLVHPFMPTLPPAQFSRTTGFIMEFDSTGKQLLFSTYFGSATEGSVVQAVAADSAGKIHVAGIANNTLHTTAGSFHPVAPPPPPLTTASFGYAAKIDPNAAAPAVCLPSSLAFGLDFSLTRVGQSTTANIVLTNCGTAPLSLTSVVSSDPVFTVDTTLCAAPVAPNATCSVPVTFTPVAAIQTNAQLTLTTNTPLVVTALSVVGTGVVPVINISGSTTFDPTLVGQAAPPHQLFIQNNGGAPLQIDVAHTTIAGADFSFSLPNCSAPLNPGAACILTLNFTPQAAGTRTGTLTVASDDPANPQVVVSLSGVGVSAFPVPTLTTMSRSTVAIGTTNLTLFISGGTFFPTSVVHIAGQPQKTTYGGATSLSAAVDPTLLSAMAELPVTVVNPAPGGGESAPQILTVYRQLNLDPSFLVSVPSRKLLYASIPASATTNPNTVIAIDPETGSTQAPIVVGNDPRALAVSDDGSFLFVAAQGAQVIQRINLATGQIDRTFAYPTNSLVLSRPFRATMLTVPGSQTSLLVHFTDSNSFGGVMALFNDAGLVNSVPDLTQFFDGVDVSSFAFTDPGTAYSLPFTLASPFFNVFTIDATGLHFTPVTGSNVGGNSTTGLSLISDGKLLYTKAGQVWDPVAKTQVGTFPITAINPTSFPNLYDMAMDTAAGQFFMVADQASNNASGVTLTAYDLKLLSTTGTLIFTELNDPTPQNLVRWGTTGFGFLTRNATFTGEDLILFRSGLSKNTAPAVTLSGSIADFGSLDAGVTSAAQSLTLTNSGNAPLNVRSTTATGDFAATNTCAATIASNASCTVLITFKPTTAGARTGLLIITDDATSGEIVIGLSGTGTTPTLTIAPATGASTTATVTAGQTATYTLSIAATPGAAGAATLSCSGAPTNSTCTVSPSSLNLSSGTNATFTVTVNTQVVRTAALRFQGAKLASIGLAFLAPVALLFATRRRFSYCLQACVMLVACMPLIALTGCGGGGASSPPPAQQTFTTPAGTYTVTISASTATATVSQPLTLTVH